MSSNIALPDLKNWAQQHLSAIIKATTPAAFDTAFNNFVSAHATVTVNGKHISRDEYKKLLQGEGFNSRELGATVTFEGAVEVHKDNANAFEGVVGLFYTAVIDEKVIVHDVPVSHRITSSLNLVIEEDKSIKEPHFPSGVHGGGFDGRRVSALNQVIFDLHPGPK